MAALQREPIARYSALSLLVRNALSLFQTAAFLRNKRLTYAGYLIRDLFLEPLVQRKGTNWQIQLLSSL